MMTVYTAHIKFKDGEYASWSELGWPSSGGDPSAWTTGVPLLQFACDLDEDEPASKLVPTIKSMYVFDGVFNLLAAGNDGAAQKLEAAAHAVEAQQSAQIAVVSPDAMVAVNHVWAFWQAIGLLASNRLNSFKSGTLTLRYLAPWHQAYSSLTTPTVADHFTEGKHYIDLLREDEYWNGRISSIAQASGSCARALQVEKDVEVIKRAIASLGGVSKLEFGVQRHSAEMSVLRDFKSAWPGHLQQLGADRLQDLEKSAYELINMLFTQIRKIEPTPLHFVKEIKGVCECLEWTALRRSVDEAR
jgi:hypothetical protein